MSSTKKIGFLWKIGLWETAGALQVHVYVFTIQYGQNSMFRSNIFEIDFPSKKMELKSNHFQVFSNFCR